MDKFSHVLHFILPAPSGEEESHFPGAGARRSSAGCVPTFPSVGFLAVIFGLHSFSEKSVGIEILKFIAVTTVLSVIQTKNTENFNLTL